MKKSKGCLHVFNTLTLKSLKPISIMLSTLWLQPGNIMCILPSKPIWNPQFTTEKSNNQMGCLLLHLSKHQAFFCKSWLTLQFVSLLHKLLMPDTKSSGFKSYQNHKRDDKHVCTHDDDSGNRIDQWVHNPDSKHIHILRIMENSTNRWRCWR